MNEIIERLERFVEAESSEWAEYIQLLINLRSYSYMGPRELFSFIDQILKAELERMQDEFEIVETTELIPYKMIELVEKQ